jgi:cytoskeletal protein CcmA (bactofilin family)
MFARRIYRLILVLSVLALLLAATAPTVMAFDSRGGDLVVIGEDEVVEEDLYVGASTFILDGVVRGDLVVFAAEIEINGTVEGDLIAAAGSTIVSGSVGDDLIVAGGATLLEEGAVVTDDLLAAGYSLEASQGTRVDGTLLFSGYQALLAGAVAEDVQVAAAGLSVRGQVGGDLAAQVGGRTNVPLFDPLFFLPGRPRVPNVPLGLTLGPDARIEGDLRYTSEDAAVVAPGQVGGQVFQNVPERDEPGLIRISPLRALLNWVVDQIRRLVSLLLVGLLLTLLLPRFIRALAAQLEANPWGSLGRGVLILIAVPAAILVFLGLVGLLALLLGIVTLGGLAFYIGALALALAGLVAVALGLAVTYLSKIVVAYWIGRYLLERGSANPGESAVGPFLVGLVIVVVLTAIPLLGWLVNLIITLFGLGTLWLLWKNR